VSTTVHAPQARPIRRAPSTSRPGRADHRVRERATVSISGPHFGHALAAWAQEFKAWFPKYWELAGYAKPQIGYSEMFKVRELVKA
jgi:hypothetical protein